MKKKGFTLIELIVVIAIIGVLAAILVPAMLGYVRKSKITTANTTAKSIYNAFNTALVDLDTTDESVTLTDSSAWVNGNTYTGSTGDKLKDTVYGYFTDIVKVKKFAVAFDGGACVKCGVLNGNYPGAYPKPWDPTSYKNNSMSTAANQTVAKVMAGPTT